MVISEIEHHIMSVNNTLRMVNLIISRDMMNETTICKMELNDRKDDIKNVIKKLECICEGLR